MLPQELIALEVCPIGTRAEPKASHVFAEHAGKYLRHSSLQPKTSLLALERHATPTKRNFHCLGIDYVETALPRTVRTARGTGVDKLTFLVNAVRLREKPLAGRAGVQKPV